MKEFIINNSWSLFLKVLIQLMLLKRCMFIHINM